MKNKPVGQTFLSVGLIGLLLYSAAFTQDKEQSKEDLTKLFSLCKNGKHDSVALYTVYRGTDETRKWKDTYNYDNNAEKREVEEICKRINSNLETAPDFVFKEFKKETESEGTWYIWEIMFGEKKVYFAILKINGKYCLGDID